jgi:hypothetical protein
VGADNQLSEFRRAEYESEDLLQKLLADHPTMLAAAKNKSATGLIYSVTSQLRRLRTLFGSAATFHNIRSALFMSAFGGEQTFCRRSVFAKGHEATSQV